MPSRKNTRRTFLKTVPVALAAGAAAPALVRAADGPDSITNETLRCAEALTGVAFSDAEHDGMRQNVAEHAEHYSAVRAVPLGDDVEPAFSFRPRPARALPSGRATPHARIGVDRPRLATRPTDDELAFLSVTALASLLERRIVSSSELTELYLARLKRYGDRLQCVVTLTESLAREQAAAADREIRAGRYKGPLQGIPYGIKDLFATRNIRTSWGANPYKDRVPTIDATAVERMRDAGAVLVAKLTTGELAIGDVWFGGKTKNPWDPSRGSSGSSAGPASATAAGLVGVSIGTETNGSIISPSHTCGVVGLRPTYGRSSRYGCMTLRWTLDKVGAIGRAVEDCAIVLNAMYGPDGRDLTVADVPFAWNRERPLSTLKIGIVDADFQGSEGGRSRVGAGSERGRSGVGAGSEQRRRPEERRVLDEAIAALRRAGASLTPITLPTLPAAALYAILNAEAGAAFDDLVRAGRVGELTGKGPNDRANQLRVSRFIPAVEYIRAQRVRTLLGEQVEAIMESCDVFVTPSTSPSVTITNLTGHPAVTVNAGFAAGLPVGLMFTGRLYDEATLLAAALGFERARGPLDRRPPL